MRCVIVGQKVRFDPFEDIKKFTEKITYDTVGTVSYVNERHKWFSVQYNENQRTSFNFCDIGKHVFICK